MRSATRWWAWTAAILLTAPAVGSGGEASTGRPDLLVRWSDPQQALTAEVRGELVRETGALFRDWGVTLRTAPEGSGADGPPAIRVILLDCTRLGDGPAGVMGQTSTAPQEYPAVWILVPNVRLILDAAERGIPGFLLGRAVARVAAHEILHVLAPHLSHASTGLMRSHLNSWDLTHPSVRMDEPFRRALVEAVSEPTARQTAAGSRWGVDLTPGQSTPDRPVMAPVPGPAELGDRGAQERPTAPAERRS